MLVVSVMFAIFLSSVGLSCSDSFDEILSGRVSPGIVKTFEEHEQGMFDGSLDIASSQQLDWMRCEGYKALFWPSVYLAFVGGEKDPETLHTVVDVEERLYDIEKVILARYLVLSDKAEKRERKRELKRFNRRKRAELRAKDNSAGILKDLKSLFVWK